MEILPSIESAVDIEKIKWKLTLWAGRFLLVTCPTEYARHTVSMLTAFNHSCFLKRYSIQANCTTAPMVPETQLIEHLWSLLFILILKRQNIHLLLLNNDLDRGTHGGERENIKILFGYSESENERLGDENK
jgi:hypothetical protein